MDLSFDAFLGGAFTLAQPKNGYRAGQDPVLLAAALDLKPGQNFLDVGCGAGAISACLMARISGLHGHGLEVDADLAGLAAKNVNAIVAQQPSASWQQVCADLLESQKPFASQGTTCFDWVVSNPHFLMLLQGGKVLMLSGTEGVRA